jgi:hypothetical protein
MIRSVYFDDFADIRSAVSQRLLAVTDITLPTDGSAGPPPFDIEPLEKWLFEAYVRHYKDDTTRHGAFWAGFSDALETFLPSGSQNLECISRCAELLEHISNDPSIANVKKESFVQVNTLLARSTSMVSNGRNDSKTDTQSEANVLRLKTALFKIAFFTEQAPSFAAVLQTELDLRQVVLAATGAGPQLNTPLIADAICWLLRAWAHLGNRDILRRGLVTQWCMASDDHRERFEHGTRAMERVMQRCGENNDLVIWAELISAACGTPLAAGARRATTPRYFSGFKQRHDPVKFSISNRET